MDYSQIIVLWQAAWPYITLAVSVASVLNTLPQPAPGSHWTPLRKAIAFVAIEFGGARSAKAPELGPWFLRLAASYMASQNLTTVNSDKLAGLVAQAYNAQPAPVMGVAPAAAPVVQEPLTTAAAAAEQPNAGGSNA